MKSVLDRMSKKILTYLNRLIPKRKIILFDSFPNICDNSYALYEYIINNRSDICNTYNLVWAKNGYVNLEKLKISSNTTVIEKKSLKGVLTFLQAKYIISTHGYFMNVKSGKGQTQVNLWHGCGYKDLPLKDRGYRGDMTIVTSNTHKKLYSEFFMISEKNVFITGYPRNDVLFKKCTALEKLNIHKDEYKQVILWMPTYRKATQGHDGIDGKVNSLISSSLTNKECALLNKTLNKNKILMIAKLHPMESSSLDRMQNLSNVRCITSQNLQDFGVQLYELLSVSDALLCDYSSLVVDYLLLDKPIAMVLSDMKEYKENRGFVFDPITDYFPGPIISSLDDLITYLNDFEKINNGWIKKRTEIKNMMHEYQDDESSKRVTKLIWG